MLVLEQIIVDEPIHALLQQQLSKNLCQQDIDLKELLLNLFPQKYSNQAYSCYHILRSLQFFDDAEKEPPLHMLTRLNWEEIKEFFLQETAKLTKENFFN